MNDTIFWRLVWKEYRSQRWFWMGVVALAVVAQLVVLMVADRTDERTMALFYVAWWLPVFYALGCGAVLFAAEQEDDTAEWLRILPTTPGRLLASKVGFSLVSVAAMIGVLQLLAFVFAGENVPAANGARLAVFGVTTAEFLVWSIFFSLTMRRVLNAVALAALCALMVNWNNSVWLRGIMFASIAGADAWLVRDWLLLGRPIGWPFSFGLRWPLRQRAALTDVESTAAPWRRALTRLLWHERRQAWPFAGVSFTLGILLILLSPLGYQWLGADFAYFIIPIMPLVMGVCVFRGEQHGRRYRFLAEHGVAPESVWLTKQVVWIALLAVAMIVFLTADHFVREFCAWLSTQAEFSRMISKTSIQPDVFTVLTSWARLSFVNTPWRRFPTNAPVYWLLFATLSYAAGQLMSLLFARSVMAAFLGLILAGLSTGWLILMHLAQVPLVWSVAPIPIILLLTTLVRCRSWMLERNTWGVWLRVGATSVVPLSAVFAGVVVYRVYEVPATVGANHWIKQVSFEPPTTDELQTADMYRQSLALCKSPSARVWPDENQKTVVDGWQFAGDRERQRLETNQEALELLLEATRRDSCVFTDPSCAQLDEYNNFDAGTLNRLLLLSARKLEAEGDLDQAFERYVAAVRMGRHVANRATSTFQWSRGSRIISEVYRWLPHWAAHPAQTPARIRSAIQRIQDETAKFPSPVYALATQRAIKRKALTDDIDSLFYLGSAHDDPGWLFALFLARYCPWERARAVRTLDAVTVTELAQIKAVEEWMQHDTRDLAGYCCELDEARWDYKLPPWNWIATTPVVSLSDYGIWPEQSWRTRLRVSSETSRRANLLIIAILAWRLEHGELPSRLDQLANANPEISLVDPWSGTVFGYYLAGLPHDFSGGFAKVAAGAPFLWSAGPQGARLVPRTIPPKHELRYVVRLPNGVIAAQEYGDGSIVYIYGRLFPIPVAQR